MLWIFPLKRGTFSTVDLMPCFLSLSYYFYWLKITSLETLSTNFPSLFAVFLILTTGFSLFFSVSFVYAKWNVRVVFGMKILFCSSYYLFFILFLTNSSVPALFKIGSFFLIFWSLIIFYFFGTYLFHGYNNVEFME